MNKPTLLNLCNLYILTGGCIWASPIRYLRDSDSQCVEQLTAELCTNSPRLNARLYVESTTLLDSTCPDSIVVCIKKYCLTFYYYKFERVGSVMKIGGFEMKSNSLPECLCVE